MKKVEVVSKKLFEYISDEIIKGGDIDNNIIIFPNLRQGYWLKQSIYEKLGRASYLPKIFSIDEFVEFILLNSNVIYKDADRYDMLVELYALKKDLEAIFLQEMNFDKFIYWGNIILNDFEELKINGIRPEDIKIYDFLIKDGIADKKNINIEDY